MHIPGYMVYVSVNAFLYSEFIWEALKLKKFTVRAVWYHLKIFLCVYFTVLY